MNHLTDIEELIAKVKHQDVRPFITEAAMCYAAGAYRGAIVIAALALFDDLKRKINELAPINSAARVLNEEIKRKVASQEVYETFLTDQLAAIGIISTLEKGILDGIKGHRNKAAHPSGHNPSAEEARYVIHETVTTFLAKAELYTTQRADWVINSLKSDNFFPSNQIEDIKKVIREEIKALHSGVYHYLVEKVVSGITASSGKENNNLCLFIIGLAALTHENPELFNAVRRKFVERCVERTEFSIAILASIHANPRLILPESDSTFMRFSTMLSNAVPNIGTFVGVVTLGHPVALFSSLFNELGASFLGQNLANPLNSLIEHATFDGEVVKIATSIPTLKPAYVAKIQKRVGSSDFGIANNAAEKIVGIDQVLALGLDEFECLSVIFYIVRAARGNAWSAQRLANSHFPDLPAVKAKALAAMSHIDEADFQDLAAQTNSSFQSKAAFQSLYL